MTTIIASPAGISLISLLAVVVVLLGYLIWAKFNTPVRHEVITLNAPKPRSYVSELTYQIEDISKKAKSIKDDEVRAYWLNYVQELRIRQLKVLQELQDKEYRDLQQRDFWHLSDSDIRSSDLQVQRGINWAANRSL